MRQHLRERMTLVWGYCKFFGVLAVVIVIGSLIYYLR